MSPGRGAIELERSNWDAARGTDFLPKMNSPAITPDVYKYIGRNQRGEAVDIVEIEVDGTGWPQSAVLPPEYRLDCSILFCVSTRFREFQVKAILALFDFKHSGTDSIKVVKQEGNSVKASSYGPQLAARAQNSGKGVVAFPLDCQAQVGVRHFPSSRDIRSRLAYEAARAELFRGEGMHVLSLTICALELLIL
jgi:hypothetical protein